MKGIVFNVFTGMVDEKFGEEMTEKLIAQSDLPSKGAYTGVGTYCFKEMVALVTALSKETNLPGNELQKIFGEYLFGKLAAKYPMFQTDEDTLFTFLEKIENSIHVQVKKLYPEAELPTFENTRPFPHVLELTYQSKRPFADVAEGLIRGAMAHFGEEALIEREDFEVEVGSKALFRLTKQV
ncbi:heme NO-binding domain-containing protein [Curvivirga aplysinae]|uniref:heme NO-binding domain-containing protein n=1 Tax=Curvivirga aplysinae TaxID=2529852 RepID=UPI0012BC0629|nr:heme NO-binding domain-containing protein [Curvivirga aplysinae]MTI08226.1 hypothetical protein [Curvivirga aplysinae]